MVGNGGIIDKQQNNKSNLHANLCRLLSSRDGLPKQPGIVECGGYMLSFTEAIITTDDILNANHAAIAQTGYDGWRSSMHSRIMATVQPPIAAGDHS
jgi:hypothetical protein